MKAGVSIGQQTQRQSLARLAVIGFLAARAPVHFPSDAVIHHVQIRLRR